jgi:hypothetical protein
MSRLTKYATKRSAVTTEIYERNPGVENFMGGTSFELSPLTTLRIVAASSIFGEPQFYRDGLGSPRNLDTIQGLSILGHLFTEDKTAVDVFTESIDAALSYDFAGTLALAKDLRTKYNMRLNPAVIFVRAMMHPNRASFNENNPGYLKSVGKAIALRPDDITNQFDYYMFLNKTKKGLPSNMKRTWAETLESFSRYQLNKYKGKKLIDLVRISHASNEDINELMKTGSLAVNETEQTWETLRSAGKSWKEILETINMPHMALLRNLRNIFTDITDRVAVIGIMNYLRAGVVKGKQFPFRYWSAYKVISVTDIENKQLVLDKLEECMDVAIANTPKLKGKVISLCDNSGSAQGTTNSEYGSVQVSTIANLSALITAANSDEGYVGVFGDDLNVREVSKRNGILGQLKESNEIGFDIGQATENGIWLFFDKAIKNKEHWDTIFIYSDMQAGHGGLYGTNPNEYEEYLYRGHYIDVLALVRKYRETVNPKVNIFSVQVAGYNNSALPENLYRGAILGGWTGKETTFANEIINIWDETEKK